MTAFRELLRAHEELRTEGTRLAGSLSDLAQRATFYHHLFEHSHGNHVFPLIAAHGALWAKGYFAFGMMLGDWVNWTSLSRATRLKRITALRVFADAFREINRRVCVDTYTSYHFTRIYGDHPLADRFVEPQLLVALNRMHAARRVRQELPDDQKRDIFQRFFRNEQEYVVGPSVQEAVARFDWPLIKFVALKPVIRFAYFPARKRLRFSDFSDQKQRITQGLQAFDWAAEMGWDGVVAALGEYGILPREFFAGSAEHFEMMRTGILGSPV